MIDPPSRSNEQLAESLRMLYREHTDQARHHDAMRERSTAVIVALATVLATAVIAYVELAKTSPTWGALALSVPIVVAGGFGVHLARAHSQNNRQHVQIARAYRLVLQVILERAWDNERDEGAPKGTEREVQEALKWLADKLPTIKQTRAGINSYLSRLDTKKRELLHCSLSRLLPSTQSLDRNSFEVLASNEITHRFGAKYWYKAVRDGLDDSMRSLAPYDFRTIRDYGHARHNLKRFEGEKSLWSGYVATGWAWVNALVSIFGLALCIWIVVKNTS